MSLSKDAVAFLIRLVDDGPIREDVKMTGPEARGWCEIADAKLAEMVFGKDGRSLLRATFAGKKLRAEWREHAMKLLR